MNYKKTLVMHILKARTLQVCWSSGVLREVFAFVFTFCLALGKIANQYSVALPLYINESGNRLQPTP